MTTEETPVHEVPEEHAPAVDPTYQSELAEALVRIQDKLDHIDNELLAMVRRIEGRLTIRRQEDDEILECLKRIEKSVTNLG